MTMSFLEPETKRLLDNLPWYWQCVHWILTIFMSLILLVLVLLAFVNPLWFRDWGVRQAGRACDAAHRVRFWILGRVYRKYNLFEILKH